MCMEAALAGTLRLEGGCLHIESFGGDSSLVPIWPPEFTLPRRGDQVLVIDGAGEVAARAGEEVYMGGGGGGADEWVLQQLPPACRGEYFIVGCQVRPKPAPRFAALCPGRDLGHGAPRRCSCATSRPSRSRRRRRRYRSQASWSAYDYRRCLHLQTEWGPGSVTLLWPAGWSARRQGETIAVLDATGQIVAQMGDEVQLRGRAIPQSMDVAVYRQLIDELPGDCVGFSWLVDGVE